MRFADELRQAAEPIWAAIFAHPLLRQLGDGTLPIDTFRYFLIQDHCCPVVASDHYCNG